MRFFHWDTEYPATTALTYQGHPVPEFISQVLCSRGISNSDAARHFLDCDEPLHDPFLLKDMDKAVTLISQMMEDGKKILIYGDYDCDGITATVLLYDYLDNAGADVCYYIPERVSEGYGLNMEAVKMVKASGIDLIITVDNGISSRKEVQYAKEQGIAVIITDHHSLPEELPEADAVIDPVRPESEYPFRQLCGAGVAFKLVCALEQNHQGDDVQDFLLDEYGDLLTIATLADIVPLKGENRLLTRRGLQVLAGTQRPGLLALAEAAKLDITACTSESVAFMLAPRINATGRIGSVDTAVQLLLCNDEEQAATLAKEINELNSHRREMEEQISREALQLIEKDAGLLHQRVLILIGDDWHQGVIGITASRMVERFRKPCIVISCSGGVARGSARSVTGFSIIDAIRSCGDLLDKFGGHPMAAGFSLKEENIPAFTEALLHFSAEYYPVMPVQTLKTDAQLSLSDITLSNVDALLQLAPFGCENSQPVFLLREMTIVAITSIGNGQHLRLSVQSGGVTIPLVYFGVSAADLPFTAGEKVDIACCLGINLYNEQRRISVRVLNIHPTGFDSNSQLHDLADFDAMMRGEPTTDETLGFSRNDLATVFRFLRENNPYRRGPDALHYELSRKIPSVRYFTVQAAVQIMLELKLITVDGTGTITILPAAQKANLEDSATYQKLSP